MIMEFVWGVLILGFAVVYALPLILGLAVKGFPSYSTKFPTYTTPATFGAGIWAILISGAVLALVIMAIRHVAPTEAKEA